MSSDDLLRQGTREIVELHRFFESWFRGTIDTSAFRRFEEALGDEFVIVTPGGVVLERQAILDAVRARYGADRDAKIEVRKIVLRMATDGVAVFTYEEIQALAGGVERGRVSTAVLVRDDSAANGFRWRHLHETWLP